MPVKDGYGKVRGVVVAQADAGFLSDMLKDLKGSRSGNALILNAEGTTVGHTDASYVTKKENFITNAKTDRSLAGMAAACSKMIREKTGVSAYASRGVERYIAFAPVTGTSWVLGVVAVKSEVMSGITALRDISVTVSLLATVIFALLCALLIRSLVGKPLRDTARMLQELAGGRWAGGCKCARGTRSA